MVFKLTLSKIKMLDNILVEFLSRKFREREGEREREMRGKGDSSINTCNR